MKISKNIRVHPSILAWLFVLLSVVLFITAFMEFQSRKADIIKILSFQASSLAEVINRSATNSILAYDNLEEEISERLFSALRQVERHFKKASDIEKETSALVNRMGLTGLIVFSPDGKRLYLYPDDLIPVQEIPGFLSFIYEGGEKYAPRLVEDTESGSAQVVGAIRMSNGLILMGMLNGDRLSKFRKQIGVGSLLNSIISDSAIVYIAIQDTLGIIAASRNVDYLSSLKTDDFLRDAYHRGDFSWRIYLFHGTRTFEAALPFRVLGTDYGMIRIGVDYSPFRELQSTAIRQTAIRFLIVLLFGFLIFFYSIAVQNVQYLEKERQKIKEELLKLQEDLSRKEKLSAMGHLAAGVAHEIRNPLNAISMVVQRIGKECAPAENRAMFLEMIKSVRKEINRIGEIINQFLNFAKPPPLNLRKHRIDLLLKEIKNLYSSGSLTAGRKIILNISEPIEWKTDPEKMKQAIMNLVANAIDATGENGRVTIDCRKEKNRLVIEVRDNGKGISEEDMERIFNLYFTTKPEGTGLGLAIVHQIISEHGGQIHVESRLGEGSRFIITLPGNEEE